MSLTKTYTCKFCKKTFSPDATPIIGEKPEEKLMRTGQLLAKHLEEHHKPELVQITLAGNQFSGWLLFEQWEHNDPLMQEQSHATRLRIRQVTQRVIVPDEALQAQVDEHLYSLGDSKNDVRKQAVKLLRGLRDALLEVPSVPA